jgi:hypothetical protein
MRVSDRVKIRPQAQVGAQVPLNIPPVRQEQTNWCWATCARMTAAYYDNDLPRQCDFANWLFKRSACCQDGSSVACNQPATDAQIVAVYSQWGISCTYALAQVSYAALQGQIATNYPVEVGWTWTGGGGHVVLLVGCTRDATGEYVYINDPWTGAQSLMTYAAMQNGQGHGIWDATWTNIAEM